MRFRDKLKRLEREAREEFIEIEQPDGKAARFPAREGMEALLALIEGRDHPLAQAARRSPNPEWSRSFFSVFPIDNDAEDLSEP